MILKHVQNFLGIGRGRVSLRRNTNIVFRYEIRAIKSLPYVINYFETFPLKRKKAQSFKKWSEIFYMVQNKDHLKEGIIEIIKIKAKEVNALYVKGTILDLFVFFLQREAKLNAEDLVQILKIAMKIFPIFHLYCSSHILGRT